MYLDILILAQLSAQPRHGYEIKKTLQQVLGGELTLNNGVLYPALRRFEEMGAVEREVERQQGKPDRHIYHLTPLGREILHDLLVEFPPPLARDQVEFIVRVSYFDQLEPDEIRDILLARRAERRRSVEHMERILAMVEEERLPMPAFARRTLEFREAEVRHELEWIESLAREAGVSLES